MEKDSFCVPATPTASSRTDSQRSLVSTGIPSVDSAGGESRSSDTRLDSRRGLQVSSNHGERFGSIAEHGAMKGNASSRSMAGMYP